MKWLLLLLLLVPSALAVTDPLTGWKCESFGDLELCADKASSCSWDGRSSRVCEDEVVVTYTGIEDLPLTPSRIFPDFSHSVANISFYGTRSVEYFDKLVVNKTCVENREAVKNFELRLWAGREAVIDKFYENQDYCYMLTQHPTWYGATRTEYDRCISFLNQSAPHPLYFDVGAFDAYTREHCVYNISLPRFGSWTEIRGGQPLIIPPRTRIGLRVKFTTDSFSQNSYNLTITSNTGATILDPNVTGCFNTTGSGVYTLNQSIATSGFDDNICVAVNHDDVELDCQGYSINGSFGLSDFVPTVLVNGTDNFTMTDCIVRPHLGSGDYGIEIADFSSNFHFTNVNITDSYLYGFLLHDIDHGTVTDSTSPLNNIYFQDTANNITWTRVSFAGISGFSGGGVNQRFVNFTFIGGGIQVGSSGHFENGYIKGSNVVNVYGASFGSGTAKNITIENWWRGLQPGNGVQYENVSISNITTHGIHCVNDGGWNITNLTTHNISGNIFYVGSSCSAFNITGWSNDNTLTESNYTMNIQNGGSSASVVDCGGGTHNHKQGASTLLNYNFAYAISSSPITFQNCRLENFSYAFRAIDAGVMDWTINHFNISNTSRTFYNEGSKKTLWQHNYIDGGVGLYFYLSQYGFTIPQVEPDNQTFYNTTIYRDCTIGCAFVTVWDINNGENQNITLIDINGPEIVADIEAGVEGVFDCQGGTALLPVTGTTSRFQTNSLNMEYKDCYLKGGTVGIDLSTSGLSFDGFTFDNFTTEAIEISASVDNSVFTNTTFLNLQNALQAVQMFIRVDGTQFTNIWANCTGVSNACFNLQPGGPAAAPRPKTTMFRNVTIYSDATAILLNHNNADDNEVHESFIHCDGGVGVDVGPADGTVVNQTTLYNCSTAIQVDTTSTGGTYINNTLKHNTNGFIVSDAASTGNNFIGNIACYNTVDAADADANTWDQNTCSNATLCSTDCSCIAPYYGDWQLNATLNCTYYSPVEVHGHTEVIEGPGYGLFLDIFFTSSFNTTFCDDCRVRLRDTMKVGI